MLKISDFFAEITKNSLFSEIETSDLEEILKNFQLVNYKKNKLLFLQGQKVENFYLILKGGLQFFVISDEGEENIIKIADNGVITNIFDSDYSFNVKSIEDVVLLSISQKQIINLINKFPQLAKNALILQNQDNQNILNQLINIKNSDIKYRLGQFLLENSLENKNKKENFVLKYDKAKIASLLNMKPESLSRTLKKFVADGQIKVSNKEISILSEEALCNFCNKQISKKCQDFNKKDHCEVDDD